MINLDHVFIFTSLSHLPLKSSIIANESFCVSEWSESWFLDLDFESSRAIVSGSEFGLNFISSEDDELNVFSRIKKQFLINFQNFDTLDEVHGVLYTCITCIVVDSFYFQR